MTAREFYSTDWHPDARKHYESEMEYWLNFAEAYHAAERGVGWIPCAERLPDDHKLYLVFMRPNIVGIAYRPANAEVWVAPDPEQDRVLDTVTHYRELPAPPEKL